MTSSHFCTAERQFRTPLEYGSQRTPTAQWTATASGSAVLGYGKGVRIHHATVGRIKDFGVTDVANMGAAMAPAAAQTLLDFFADTATGPADYDRIYTGDLGAVGTALLRDLLAENGVHLENHDDCGLLLYDRETQDVHAGRLGLRLLRQRAVRAYPEPHGARRAAQHPVHGDRRADVHDLLPAGRKHPGHRAPPPPAGRMKIRRRSAFGRRFFIF